MLRNFVYLTVSFLFFFFLRTSIQNCPLTPLTLLEHVLVAQKIVGNHKMSRAEQNKRWRMERKQKKTKEGTEEKFIFIAVSYLPEHGLNLEIPKL